MTVSGDITVDDTDGVILGHASSRFRMGYDEYMENSLEGVIGMVGDLSIEGNLSIFGTGSASFKNSSFRVGSGNPSDFGDDTGDLWIENDLEIRGNMSMGANLTIAVLATFGDGITVPEDLTIEGTLFTDVINGDNEYDLLTICKQEISKL